MVKKSTPVLCAERIEPLVGFFEALGFNKTVEVPHGENLGFAILDKDGVEVMAQSYASIEDDVPQIADAIRNAPSVLFIEVENLDKAAAQVASYELVMPRRETFYGAMEITVKTPGGHLVTLAEFKEQADA